MTTSSDDTLARLAAVIEARKGGDPDKSYVARLFAKGNDAILKKIGEEATETVRNSIILVDFIELRRREGLSGLEEFAARKARTREEDGT